MPAQLKVNRPRKKPRNLWQLWLVPVIKLILSPVVLIWDSFRVERLRDQSWLYAFSLLTTVILGVAFAAIIITDGPADQTLKMLATVKSHPTPLEGDLDPVINTINEYGLKYDVDPNLIFALIKNESNFNSKATSRRGARGLMQITPFIWREYSGSTCPGTHGNKLICSNGNCIYDPRANIRVGVKYLRTLIDYYQGRVDLAIEAYNAGLTNVIPGVAPKYGETRYFLRRVFLDWHDLRQQALFYKLELALRFRRGFRQLFGAGFLCWVIFFWWANRKLFPRKF
jgi:hypothetical protein